MKLRGQRLQRDSQPTTHHAKRGPGSGARGRRLVDPERYGCRRGAVKRRSGASVRALGGSRGGVQLPGISHRSQAPKRLNFYPPMADHPIHNRGAKRGAAKHFPWGQTPIGAFRGSDPAHGTRAEGARIARSTRFVRVRVRTMRVRCDFYCLTKVRQIAIAEFTADHRRYARARGRRPAPFRRRGSARRRRRAAAGGGWAARCRRRRRPPRVAADRPDRRRRADGAPRAVQPARRLRRRGARPPAGRP